MVNNVPKFLQGDSEKRPKGEKIFNYLRTSPSLRPQVYARSRKGGARLGRKTIGKRYRSTLIAMNDKLRKLRNLLSFRELHVHLCRVLKGYYNYYGFAGNAATLNKFAYAVKRMWFKWLNRRSQRKSFNWEEFKERLKRFPLPKPRIVKGYSWIYAAGV